MHLYEIEIKVLLTTLENKEKLLTTLQTQFPDMQLKGRSAQLNHYFIWGDFSILKQHMLLLLSWEKFESLEKVLNHEGKFSFRTRFVDGNSILVIKLSLGPDSSANGVSRLEWEQVFEAMPIQGLDYVLLQSGFDYQAKWSREREEYILPKDMIVCIDKNAGYGYLAEFEKVIDDKEKVWETKQEIQIFISSLWFEELPQSRLERMFDFYNKNWSEYYGTEKYFVVD
jgi:adenylate cyclase class IV